jgi:hypothetical protein
MPVRRSAFTVSWLMALVLAFGIELAAARTFSTLADAASFDLTAAIFIFASLAARFGDEAKKAWWFGFALFGWCQFMLVMVFVLVSLPDEVLPPTHWVTLELMNRSLPALQPPPFDPSVPRRFETLRDSVGWSAQPIRYFYLKANAAMSLLVATVGGLMTHFAATRWSRQSRDSAG